MFDQNIDMELLILKVEEFAVRLQILLSLYIIQPFFERDCIARYIVIKQTQ